MTILLAFLEIATHGIIFTTKAEAGREGAHP
jgi:hypothetical protein